jgi:hypothetical protein
MEDVMPTIVEPGTQIALGGDGPIKPTLTIVEINGSKVRAVLNQFPEGPTDQALVTQSQIVEFDASKPVNIGRSPGEGGIVLENSEANAGVSRKQGVLRVQDGQLRYEDTGKNPSTTRNISGEELANLRMTKQERAQLRAQQEEARRAAANEKRAAEVRAETERQARLTPRQREMEALQEKIKVLEDQKVFGAIADPSPAEIAERDAAYVEWKAKKNQLARLQALEARQQPISPPADDIELKRSTRINVSSEAEARQLTQKMYERGVTDQVFDRGSDGKWFVEVPNEQARAPGLNPKQLTNEILGPEDPASRKQASAPAQNAKFGTGMAGGALGLDLYHFGEAAIKGDKEAMLASTGSATVNGATLADQALFGAGKSTGAVSGMLGKVVPVGVVATTSIQVAQIQAEGGVDAKQRSTEAVVTNAAGFGAALGTGAAITASGVAAGSGLVVGALATGGTVLVAAAAAAAVAYGMNKADQAMYGAEDARFGANLQQKQHMIALGNGKFRDQLADPETGRVDLNNIETLNKLSVLAQKEIYKQEEIMKENSSYVPRWMRSGESVIKQESARSDMKIAESAKEEINQRVREIQQLKQVQKQAEEKISGLLNNKDKNVANERDAILTRTFNGSSSPEQKQKDIERLGESDMLGDKKLAEALVTQVEKQGQIAKAKEQAEPIRESNREVALSEPRPKSVQAPVMNTSLAPDQQGTQR